ncbi:MAG: transaldolase [Bacteroidota bacterium]|nr:transaldolase [Bacteroidota bacterium]
MDNPLMRIRQYGQSIWLDFIGRGIMNSGEFKRLILEDGISGVTSNPDIFERSILESNDYDDAINSLILEDKSKQDIYDAITIEDIQRAADLLLPTYEQTNYYDGYVSLEVSPHMAFNTRQTIKEARRLWKEVSRPNLMIKVPGVKEGIDAVEKLTSEGMNINITLLFDLDRYREIAEAYISGLEYRINKNKSIELITSVASFFLSRIDTLADEKLALVVKQHPEQAGEAQSLMGQTAIASAKVAYKIYKELFYTERFKKIEDKWGRKQRLLWASTSTKNPEYSDIKYVEPLIGPETINTLPLKTIETYRKHGDPKSRIEDDLEDAENVLKGLKNVGINLKGITKQLEKEAVEKFIKPYDKLMDTLEHKMQSMLIKQY